MSGGSEPLSQGLTGPFNALGWVGMAIKTIYVSLPGGFSGYVERTVQGGRCQDASEVVREVLRRMEAPELADELRQLEGAFASGHNRSEPEEDIQVSAWPCR